MEPNESSDAPPLRAPEEVLAALRAFARNVARLFGAGAIVGLPTPDDLWLVPIVIEHGPLAAPSVAPRRLAMTDEVVSRLRASGVVIVAPEELDLPELGLPIVRNPTGAVAMIVGLTIEARLVATLTMVQGGQLRAPSMHDVVTLRRMADACSEQLRRMLPEGAALPHADVERPAVTLQEVASALVDAATFADVADILVELGVRAVGALGGAVIVSTGERAEVFASEGLPPMLAPAGARIAADEEPYRRVLREGDALWLTSAEAIARTFPEVPFEAAAGIGSLALVALRSDHRTLGAMLLRMPPGRALELHIRAGVRLLSRSGAHALDRARLYEAERRARARLEILAAATARFASSLDLAETVSAIGECLVPACARGCSIDLLRDGALERVLDVGAKPDQARCTLELPLAVRDQPLGVLCLYRDEAIEAEDRALLAELARRAALALDAARLFREREEALRIREDFLGIAGHELRTPLTALKIWLYSAQKFGLQPSDLATASRQLDRLERLVDELLDVTRIHAGRLALDRRSTDLCALVREITQHLERDADRAETRIDVTAPDSLVGSWDAFRLGQVFTNLVSNAIKYAPGKPIEVTLEEAGDRARLRVRDRGMGIAADDQARIFERFERAVSSRNYGGVGLGLWISRQIVEAHGGTIRVESKPGQGSEFVVELPR